MYGHIVLIILLFIDYSKVARIRINTRCGTKRKLFTYVRFVLSEKLVSTKVQRVNGRPVFMLVLEKFLWLSLATFKKCEKEVKIK